MVSNKTIRLMESHEEEISQTLLRSIRHHPEMANLGKLSEMELRESASDILRNLGHWLAHGHEEELAPVYENLGRLRFEQGIPLDEPVRAVCLLKEKMMDFVDEQGSGQDYLALYAEEQFERRIGRFFDLLTIHLVRGYQKASRHTAHAAHAV